MWSLETPIIVQSNGRLVGRMSRPPTHGATSGSIQTAWAPRGSPGQFTSIVTTSTPCLMVRNMIGTRPVGIVFASGASTRRPEGAPSRRRAPSGRRPGGFQMNRSTRRRPRPGFDLIFGSCPKRLVGCAAAFHADCRRVATFPLGDDPRHAVVDGPHQFVRLPGQRARGTDRDVGLFLTPGDVCTQTMVVVQFDVRETGTAGPKTQSEPLPTGRPPLCTNPPPTLS